MILEIEKTKETLFHNYEGPSTSIILLQNELQSYLVKLEDSGGGGEVKAYGLNSQYQNGFHCGTR